MPIAVPIAVVMKTIINEDNTVICAPMIMRDNKSLPYWSVPNKCILFGGVKALFKFCAYGSNGTINGAKSAIINKILIKLDKIINFKFMSLFL